nr:head maturation protease, ClpP-related [uncultured Aminipila sp.]
MKKFYSLVQEDRKAELMIYGDITSWEWLESDVSSYTLSKQLENLDVDEVHVYINSYGGEVAEGLAIYNALRRHQAKVTTYCDGFACSAASVVFMAGVERVMGGSSLLLIHNAWTYTSGDSNNLRKEAEDLEQITKASILAYMKYVNIEETQLKQMMDEESWILPQEAVDMGFATRIAEAQEEGQPSQSVKYSLLNLIKNKKQPKEELTAAKIADVVVEKLTQSIAEEPKKDEGTQSKKLSKFLKGLTQ